MTNIRCVKQSDDPDGTDCQSIRCCICNTNLWISNDIYTVWKKEIESGEARPVCSTHSITGALEKVGIL